MQGISVIICCYNSAARIEKVLQHLQQQKTEPSLCWEIILVDNNSTDDTATVAKKFWENRRQDKPLQVIYEEQAGLSFARSAGVHAANYDVVLFCDDDNFLNENYVQDAYHLILETRRQGFGVWGGYPIPYFDEDTQPPYWFESVKERYAVGKQAASSGDICDRGYVWGAGMLVLRDIFFAAFNKSFPPLLTDRKKDILSSGNDSELCLRLLIMGYKIYYDEQLTLQHYIPAYKLNESYSQALQEGISRAATVLNKYYIFLHYVIGKNIIQHFYFYTAYQAKNILNRLHFRKLTDHDTLVLHALFQNQFNDADFSLMYRLKKLRTKNFN
jgi:glycosyltransferase involved in cell wall biosynthesis